ncbi:MAG: GNAT family N-acetyltransferase [Pseudomonadota bacterium]
MTENDVPACLDIINHTIRLGGTTSDERPYTLDGLKDYYFRKPKIANVIEDNGRIAGFQGVFETEPGLYSIGSFTDQKNSVRGVGRALGLQMIADCRADGGHAIIAKILSDNVSGLAYYASLGLSDWQVWENDHQRPDGTWVDRIVKRIEL